MPLAGINGRRKALPCPPLPIPEMFMPILSNPVLIAVIPALVKAEWS